MLSLSISKPQHPNTAVSHRHGSLTRQDRARKEPRDGAVAQMGERCNRTAEVRGSKSPQLHQVVRMSGGGFHPSEIVGHFKGLEWPSTVYGGHFAGLSAI